MLSKGLHIAFRLISWTPLTGLLWLYAFALIARIKYGHFLTPDVRVPMYRGWEILHDGVSFFLAAILLGLPLWLILFGFHWWKGFATRPEVVSFFLGWGLLLVQVSWDPFWILHWYLD